MPKLFYNERVFVGFFGASVGGGYWRARKGRAEAPDPHQHITLQAVVTHGPAEKRKVTTSVDFFLSRTAAFYPQKGTCISWARHLSECLPCLAHSGIIFSNLALSSLFFSCWFYDIREGSIVYLLCSTRLALIPLKLSKTPSKESSALILLFSQKVSLLYFLYSRFLLLSYSS